jgi:hypothetical protein
MRFWDASAIVPLLVGEPSRTALLQLLEQDSVMIVWWGTPVECVSAIARREREALLSLDDATAAIARLRALASAWQEVLATEPVRNTAQRLLRTRPLRSADSLQLAAAIVAAVQVAELMRQVTQADPVRTNTNRCASLRCTMLCPSLTRRSVRASP